MSRNWHPILPPSTPLGNRLETALGGIARSLRNKKHIPSPSVLRGSPHELALLFGYLALSGWEEDLQDVIEECLNNAVDTAAGLRPGLFAGLSGLGWVVQHLSREFNESHHGEVADEQVTSQIDAAILGWLRRGAWVGGYDLISGLVGFGAYFLERLPTKAAQEGVELVLNYLEMSAEIDDSGITWITRPEVLPLKNRLESPKGYYDLGVAHGIPGIIYLLNQADVAGVDSSRARRLLEGAVSWLVAQSNPQGAGCRFGSSSGGKGYVRLAWCYGDLGVLAILLPIARRLGRSELCRLSHEMLENCLAWPFGEEGVHDAHLCHGAGGVAHLFNRIYQAEGNERCREAAIKWFERALARERPGAPVAGFPAFLPKDDGGEWVASTGLLAGAVGLALAMLAAITAVEPQWDRLMLLSGRA